MPGPRNSNPLPRLVHIRRQRRRRDLKYAAPLRLAEKTFFTLALLISLLGAAMPMQARAAIVPTDRAISLEQRDAYIGTVTAGLAREDLYIAQASADEAPIIRLMNLIIMQASIPPYPEWLAIDHRLRVSERRASVRDQPGFAPGGEGWNPSGFLLVPKGFGGQGVE